MRNMLFFLKKTPITDTFDLYFIDHITGIREFLINDK